MDEKTERYLAGIPATPSEISGASGPYAPDPPDEATREMHLFAKENTMSRRDGKIFGQWQSSFGKACRGAPTTFIEEGAVLDLNNVGKCSSGEDVIDCVLM